MKKTIKNFLLICMCLFFGSIDNSFAGTDAAAFLKKSVGLKAIAMGGAFTSIADDTSAIYWNPAGLAQIQDKYSVYWNRLNLHRYDFPTKANQDQTMWNK